MIAAADEPAEPGKGQPQKYTKFNALLLLRAKAKLIKRRARRDSSAGADGTTNENSNQTEENMETTNYKNRRKRSVLSEMEREENRKKRQMRDAEELVTITRDLNHLLSLPKFVGSYDDLKALRNRRFARLGEKIDIHNKVLTVAKMTVQALPFGELLEQAVKVVLVVERDEEFWDAVSCLEKIYARAARALRPDDKKIVEDEVLRQLDLFDE